MMAKLRLSSKMSKIGSVVPEIWPKRWSKWVKNDPKILGHANISRNIRDREVGAKGKL